MCQKQSVSESILKLPRRNEVSVGRKWQLSLLQSSLKIPFLGEKFLSELKIDITGRKIVTVGRRDPLPPGRSAFTSNSPRERICPVSQPCGM